MQHQTKKRFGKQWSRPIPPDLYRLFEKLISHPRVVEEAVTTLRIALEQALKSKCKLPVTISFRGVVFQFLFKEKEDIIVKEKVLPAKNFPEGSICALTRMKPLSDQI